jgi:hypothetical protein
MEAGNRSRRAPAQPAVAVTDQETVAVVDRCLTSMELLIDRNRLVLLLTDTRQDHVWFAIFPSVNSTTTQGPTATERGGAAHGFPPLVESHA